jgi:ArsR family transcriptional regulator
MQRASLSTLVQELRAAGEPTRARILALLAHGELSVGELAQILGQSQPRLSRHMKFLTAAGLVERLPEGAWVFYRLPAEGRGRELADAFHAALDPDDPELARDVQRLADARAARAVAAEAYFARAAADWDALRALHYSEAEIEAAILESAGPGPFDFVVDFGAGTGRMLILLSPRARRLEGIDLSHQMLTMARANLAAAGVANAAVRHGDVCAAPYPDGVASLVIVHQVLHFLDEPGRALAEAARVLRPGGRLVVVDFAPHTLETLRADHAHRRLGVSQADFARWSEQAGIRVDAARRFAPPAHLAEGVEVTLWSGEAGDARRRGKAA